MNGFQLLRTGLLTGVAAGALLLAAGQNSSATEIKTLGYTPQTAKAAVQTVQYPYYPGRYYSYRPYNGYAYPGYPGYYGAYYPGYWPNSYATGGTYYQYNVPNPYVAGRAFTYGYATPGGYRYYSAPW